MRKALLFLAAAFSFVSCHTNEKYTEQKLVGRTRTGYEHYPGLV